MKNVLPTFVLLVCAGLLATLIAHPAQAKIWRVDNNGGSPGNFTTLQAAFDAGSGVVDNDTLYVNGSGTSYGSATITKRVYIFGPGYFLAQNPETQASPTSAAADQLTFAGTSSGSLITGMRFNYLEINADNILVKRNYAEVNRGGPLIYIGASRSNVLLVQNYIYNSASRTGIEVGPGCSNVLLSNNLVGSAYNYPDAYYAAIASQSSISVTQNVIYRAWVYTNNSTVTNNIFRDGGLSGSGNGVLSNIGYNTDIPAGNGNLQNVNMADVFLGTGSADAMWMLKPGSPALAPAGANGEDIGMYGGADPYVLSGLPAIPAIWFFAAPTSGSGASGLQVHLKAKSHN